MVGTTAHCLGRSRGRGVAECDLRYLHISCQKEWRVVDVGRRDPLYSEAEVTYPRVLVEWSRAEARRDSFRIVAARMPIIVSVEDVAPLFNTAIGLRALFIHHPISVSI